MCQTFLNSDWLFLVMLIALLAVSAVAISLMIEIESGKRKTREQRREQKLIGQYGNTARRIFNALYAVEKAASDKLHISAPSALHISEGVCSDRSNHYRISVHRYFPGMTSKTPLSERMYTIDVSTKGAVVEIVYGYSSPNETYTDYRGPKLAALIQKFVRDAEAFAAGQPETVAESSAD